MRKLYFYTPKAKLIELIQVEILVVLQKARTI